MLRILTRNKEPVQGLDRYKQLRITKRLNLDDKTLEFSALIVDIENLENEGYIETETDRFVIKEITPSSDGTANVLAQLDVESLEGKTFVRFETVEKTLPEAMAVAFAGTGWTVGTCNITKKRTLRKEHCTAYDMLKQALSVYRCECVIDSKNQTISFYEQRGSDRGVYFMPDLNMRSLTVSRNSYDFYTEIEPYGADGMTIEDVNNGSKILTNYTYSNKQKRIIWKDERYSVPESLKEDAQAKLDDYSKPYVSYMADVVDLASMSNDYSILQYDIGDTVTLIDNATGTREAQRIVEMVVYPEEPQLNSCVFANVTLTFEELAMKFNETADTVDNITIDNGTIDGSKINGLDAHKLANFDTVLAASGVFGDLAANQAAFEDAAIKRLDADEADITTLRTNYADVGVAKINVLETNFASIRDLLAGNAAATQAQAIHLNAQNAVFDQAFLKNLIAQNIMVNDLLAGAIYTNKHTVMSEDGAMVMTGSLLTFKDASGTVRIQIGKDGQGNYNYYLTNPDGDIIWDAAGITKDGVPDGLIVDDMVADSDGTYQGISASKLNIHSMVGALNSEGGLKSSSIVMDENNQSLSVVFANLKSDVDNMSFGGRNLLLGTGGNDADKVRTADMDFTDTRYLVRSMANGEITMSPLRETSEAKYYSFINESNRNMHGLLPGETYVLSFYAKGTTPHPEVFRFVCGIQNSQGYWGDLINQAVSLPSDYQHNIITITLPKDCVGCSMCFRIYETTALTTAYIKNLKLEHGTKATDWTPAPEDLQNEWQAANAIINATLADIQDQLDGVVDTYYYDYAPTLTNIPASDWANKDYPNHKGDMFLDTSTGKSYRFLQNETTRDWSWVEIPDTASAAALVAAQDAKDVADHKRRVFVDTPYPPYDEGDLWFTGADGDILTCTNAKTANQQYARSDWSKLHKYTDDTYAVNKYSELNITIDGITGRVGTLETTTTNQGNTLASHTTTISQTANKINRIITDSQITELDTGTSMFDKLLNVEETAEGVKTDVSSLKTWKDNASGQITQMSSKQNTFEQTLSGTTSRVSDLETSLENDYSTTADVQSMIDQKAGQITLSVSNTYATKTSAVSGVSVEYALGDDAVNAPTTGWDTASPAWTTGKYIWQRTAITKNGSTTYSNVSCIQGAKGKDGTNGTDGTDGTSVSVTGTEIRYQGHTSGTSVPTGTWQVDVPTVAQGAYLWTRTKVNYSDGTSTTSYSVGRMGSNGSNGTNGTNGTNGKDGKDGTSPTVSSTVTKYQQSASGTSVPTGTWSTTPPTATAGQYMWTQTTVTYSDGATAVSYSVSRNGTNGVGITSITEYYVCTNSTTAPADSAFSTGIKTPTEALPYLWNYEKVSYTDGNTKSLDKHIVAMFGKVGADGRSISSITEYYAVNNSTTAPADSEFSTSVKTVSATNKYLWNYEKITYSTGNPDTTAKRIIGTYGDKGDAGTNGLNQATLYLYQRAASAPTKPSAVITYTFASKAFSGINNGWSTAIPSGTDPCWVTIAVASSNTTTDTIAASEWTAPVKMVENGTDGKDGTDGTNGINGYNQATINLYIRNTATPSKPLNPWTYTFSTGDLSTGAANGWTKDIPAADGKPCWVISAAFISRDDTATITKDSWSEPVKMVEDGKGISGITEYYVCTNSTSAPADSEFSTGIKTPTEAKPYLWNYEKVTYTDGNTKNLDKHIVAMFGKVGTDGRSITGIKEYYKATNSTTAPTSGWYDTVQTVTATNKYLWNYEEISYSTGNPDTTNPRIIGVYGDKGDKGDPGESAYSYDLIVSHAAVVKNVTGTFNPASITLSAKRTQGILSPADYAGRFKVETTTNNSTWTVQYTSSANESSKSWSIPSGTIAIRCSLYLAGGTTTLLDQQTIPVVVDGTSGNDAYTVVLTNESHTFPAGTSAAIAGSTTANVIAYKGVNSVTCYAGASASATSIATGVTGLTCTISNNNTKSVKLTFSATTSLTTKSGTVTIPVVVDGKTFNKVFSWALALSGQNGAPGEKGDTGVGISKVTPQFCWHTSYQSAPTSGWSSEKTAPQAGKPYLWIRSIIDYDDGSSEPTEAVCDMTLNDLESRLSSAEMKITDEAIVSTVAQTYGIADANLIYNSTGYGGSTDGWELTTSSTNYALIADYASTRPGKTDYALGVQFKTTSSTAVYAEQTSEHYITLAAGKKYTLSGFYFRGGNVRTCCIGIEYTTGSGSWTMPTALRKEFTALNTWTAFTLTFDSPGNYQARVYIRTSGSTSTSTGNILYVEDLVLVRGENAMPWAEQPTSWIEQTADAIRLKAEKLVWTAGNSSLTEEGYLTVTGGEIGGFTIDSYSIRNLANTSTAAGAILISTSDVTRTIAGVSKSNVRFAIGSKMGVLSDGTLYAKDGVFSGEIVATSGTLGGIGIGEKGILSRKAGSPSKVLYISDDGIFHVFSINDYDSWGVADYRNALFNESSRYVQGFFYVDDDGKVKGNNFSNGYWRTDGRVLRGYFDYDYPDNPYAEDRYGLSAPKYKVSLYAGEENSGDTGFAMDVSDVTGSSPVRNFVVRYNGSTQCTSLTISSLSSGTGSTVVANSSGRLYYTSSSKRYKDYISDMTESEAEKLYDLPVVQFKYKDGYLDMDDEAYDKPLYGFFAEDVADIFTDGGIHNTAGDVENYSERAIIARLVKLVQMQHKEIEQLKQSIA